MEYLPWVLVALLCYSMVAPLASYVTDDVPPAAGLFLSTVVFLVITSAVLVYTGVGETQYATGNAALIVYIAGLFLTIGILAYVTALEFGPVSIVVPIFGMFIVGSAGLGIVFLGESLSLTRVAGIACAVVAIVLGAGEG